MTHDDADTTPLRRTPLYARHMALGAKMVDFGGWDMPIEYAATPSPTPSPAGGREGPLLGGGVVAEHTAVRERVGVFDVSHMGKLRIRGAGAVHFCNAILANDLNRIASKSAQYSMLCNDSGGVVDDLIVYRRADDDVFIVPNAANAENVFVALSTSAPSGIEVTNHHDDLAIVAVQGPGSADVLTALGLPTDHDYMAFADVASQFSDESMIVCRTGYTGERGYELIVAADDVGRVWDALLETGAAYGISPAGLGARDTLRTEMGYPLHGQDLSELITPVEARLGWAVGWDKPEFRGRDALVTSRATGPTRVLRGLRATERGVPRPHMAVMTAMDGDQVGETTSGTFSPTLKQGIALALLDPAVSEGDQLVLDVRGRPLAVTVVKPPFVTASTR